MFVFPCFFLNEIVRDKPSKHFSQRSSDNKQQRFPVLQIFLSTKEIPLQVNSSPPEQKRQIDILSLVLWKLLDNKTSQLFVLFSCYVQTRVKIM